MDEVDQKFTEEEVANLGKIEKENRELYGNYSLSLSSNCTTKLFHSIVMCYVDGLLVVQVQYKRPVFDAKVVPSGHGGKIVLDMTDIKQNPVDVVGIGIYSDGVQFLASQRIKDGLLVFFTTSEWRDSLTERAKLLDAGLMESI